MDHHNYSALGHSYSRTSTPTRKPQMGVSASNHRRTLSSASSNINPGFQLDSDELQSLYQFHRLNLNPSQSQATINRMRVYENVPFKAQHDFVSNYLQTTAAQNESLSMEQPASLPFESGTKLRSSLKKYTTNPSVRPTTNGNIMQQQTATTPTNPTPPDSLTSDDSSYLSAKEGSISSQSRVRFSPETLMEQANQPAQYVNTPLAFMQNVPTRRLSRARHSISEIYAPPPSSSS